MNGENEPTPEWRIAMDFHAEGAEGSWRFWATAWPEIVIDDPAKDPVRAWVTLMTRLLAEADMTEADRAEAQRLLGSSLACIAREQARDLADENIVGEV
ncbi:hypothetical protein [Aeromicrobium ginsengisoli]|uniref:Uncharacterized protein n=1 Tax=Aeromicrobium ginsengisoli TaxID=363867 RepID=A0A5M4FHJ5_9ACTN|nr:hypothetical protein [Aeromicrobium ginsengisoli]KAA1399656.1 hypothetical protein ESP70_002525 [Aeromicrobium ginsengisoli]